MSLWRRLVGGRSFDEERELADSLFERGDFGGAKLAYERALSKADTDEARSQAKSRVEASLDGLARMRLKNARTYIASGDVALAREEIAGALETAVSPEVVQAIRGVGDELEETEVHKDTGAAALSDEDRLAMVAGTWEDAQQDEYEAYGEEFARAVLMLQEGSFAEARDTLEAVLAQADAPRYLWFEVGRARLEEGEDAAATDALQAFLSLMDPDEGGEARLQAHMLLARQADERGDQAAAIQEFEAAATALPDDPRPLLELGRYLRSRTRAAEAVEVLELACASGESAPGWQLLQELGLAYADAGKDAQAIETLEGVVGFMASRNHFDFPIPTAVTLGRLYERTGKLERAADMYRALAQGSDVDNRSAYFYEAGRLLLELGLNEEARTMLLRSRSLAETSLAKSAPGDSPLETARQTIENAAKLLDSLS